MFAIYRKWGKKNTALGDPLRDGFSSEKDAMDWFDAEVSAGRQRRVAIYVREYAVVSLVSAAVLVL